MDNKALTNKVIELLETKREDDWWDFKQEHHDDKAKLVHDIICMANNRPRKDSYIIIGIEDNTFKILGVEEDAHRRNQQVIKDILKSASFAGGIRPRVEIPLVGGFLCMPPPRLCAGLSGQHPVLVRPLAYGQRRWRTELAQNLREQLHGLRFKFYDPFLLHVSTHP